MLQSGSIHQPPTTWNRPSATRARICSNSGRSLSSTHSKKSDESHVNTNSGYSSSRSIAEWNVARTSWYPSGHCHSHTGSMWALPIMWMRLRIARGPHVDLVQHHVEHQDVHLL